MTEDREPDEWPLISVILPYHDRVDCLARSIDSILDQAYRPLEVIVMDDGSTDGSHAVAAAFGDRIIHLRQDPGGAYNARNRALEHASGQLIAFADSDDRWLPGKLQAQARLMRDPTVGLVFGEARHVVAARNDARPTGRTSFGVSPPSRGEVLDALAFRNFVPTCTVLVRRACLDEIGGFKTGSRLSADYLAWFRIARRHRFDFVPFPVCDYTVHSDGISFDLGRSLEARIELFLAEHAHEPDTRVRRVLEQLRFNLMCQFLLALVRGRATSISRPGDLLRRCVAGLGFTRAARLLAGFVSDQLNVRIRGLVR